MNTSKKTAFTSGTYANPVWLCDKPGLTKQEVVWNIVKMHLASLKLLSVVFRKKDGELGCHRCGTVLHTIPPKQRIIGGSRTTKEGEAKLTYLCSRKCLELRPQIGFHGHVYMSTDFDARQGECYMCSETTGTIFFYVV